METQIPSGWFLNLMYNFGSVDLSRLNFVRDKSFENPWFLTYSSKSLSVNKFRRLFSSVAFHVLLINDFRLQ